uniref:Uncharacterized protein n=1 Tax=Arcella intermedia TaxID=1963864 RepID=A0A6B2LLJ1_9EUKA|eukprot:TRINITY_DN1396_c0_g1_i1.p1 TRINITY_DN1396_c0_g1~~TRINITY_DN1396_c0_g1_i1.p1  ORF type:complete len:184 (-),score=41.29 TRINITY_DN1396_c0_g1_i1:63-614(-)
MGGVISAIFDALFGKKLEVVLLGLANSGKTTLLSYISVGAPPPKQPLPTLGSNSKLFQRGNVTIKAWDVGGQATFREGWTLYAENSDCILFVVDSSDPEKLPEAKRELHALLENPNLSGLPMIVACNKSDIPERLSRAELEKALNLDYINPEHQTIHIVDISALTGTNVDQVAKLMTLYAKAK